MDEERIAMKFISWLTDFGSNWIPNTEIFYMQMGFFFPLKLSDILKCCVSYVYTSNSDNMCMEPYLQSREMYM